MISTLALALSLQVAPLGTWTIMGQQVSPPLPTWAPNVRGETWSVGEGGAFSLRGERVRAAVGRSWDELLAPIPERAPLKWRINVQVVSAVQDSEDVPNLGTLTRRYDLDAEDMRQVRRELALFAAMVRTYSQNRVEIQFDADQDSAVRVDQEIAPGTMSYRLTGEREPRSLMVIHTGRTDEIQPFSIHGIPGSSVPFLAIWDQGRFGVAARWMYTAWVDQLRRALERAGTWVYDGHVIRVGFGASADLPVLESLNFVTSAMWASLTDSKYADRLPPLSGSARPWAEVADDPWSKLPFQKHPPGYHGKDLEFVEGLALVDESLAPAFAKARPEALATAQASHTGRAAVWFQNPGPKLAARELFPAMGTVAPVVTENRFDAGEAEKLPFAGRMKATTVADDIRGAVGRFQEGPFIRKSWLRVLEGNSDVKDTPILEFWIRVGKTPWPLDLVVDGQRARLFGEILSPQPDANVRHLRTGNAAEWQQVRIDLRKLGVDGTIDGVYLESPREAFFSSPEPTAPPEVFLDDVRLLAQPSGDLNEFQDLPAAEPNPRAGDVKSRLLYIRNVPRPLNEQTVAEFRSLLNDPSEDVRANVLMVLAQEKAPAAVPEIAALARSINPRNCELAAKALVFQDTEEAWRELRAMVTGAAFDFARSFAALAVTRKMKETALVADISRLLVSRSWQTRVRGGVAVAEQGTRTAHTVALAFLNDEEPAARAQMLSVLDLAVPEVLARLEEAAQFDPNPRVKAMAALRLASAGRPTALERLLKDTDWVVRAELAEGVPASKESLRPFLSDARYEVRAAAAVRYAYLPGLTDDDWGPLKQESDARVLAAILKDKKAPEPVLARLKELRWPGL